MKKLEVNEELLKKITKKGAAILLTGTMLLGGNPVISTTYDNSKVYAASSQNNQNLTSLNVQMGVNLYLNDKGFVPTDVNGTETYPFIIEGTTYVPIRAIAELFNADIIWDGKSNTVYIGTSGQEPKLKNTSRPKQSLYNMSINATKGIKLVVNSNDCIPTDVDGNIKEIYNINGTTYVPLRAVSTALGLPIAWSNTTNSVFIGEHKTTGLTVENINDIDFFDKCGRDFVELPYALGYGYTYEKKQYDLIKEVVNSKYYEGTFALILANMDYCNEDHLKFFSGISEEDFKRFTIFPQCICMYMKEGTKINFDKYIIDDNSRIALEQLQEQYLAAYKSNNYSNICKFIVDYFNNDCKANSENTNIFTNRIFAYSGYLIDLGTLTSPFDDYGFSTEKISDTSAEKGKALGNLITDFKNKIFSKTIVK